jgi:hypothetical protein
VETELEDEAADAEGEAGTGTGGVEAGGSGIVFEVVVVIVVVVGGGFTTVVPPVPPPPPPPPPPLPALLPSTGNTYPATHSYPHPEPSAPSLSAASAV